MGRIPIIELSPEAYGEIEKQLLEGGYHWLFERGPGSDIDLGQFKVRCRSQQHPQNLPAPDERSGARGGRTQKDSVAKSRVAIMWRFHRVVLAHPLAVD